MTTCRHVGETDGRGKSVSHGLGEEGDADHLLRPGWEADAVRLRDGDAQAAKVSEAGIDEQRAAGRRRPKLGALEGELGGVIGKREAKSILVAQGAQVDRHRDTASRHGVGGDYKYAADERLVDGQKGNAAGGAAVGVGDDHVVAARICR